MNNRLWVAAMLVVLAGALVASAGTLILVDPAPFPSVGAAAAAEAKVNWLDADTTDDAACTLCFAALELQRCLRRMSGRADDFAIVSSAGLDTPAGGERIRLTSMSRLTPDEQKSLADLLGVAAGRLAALRPGGYCIKTVAIGGDRAMFVVGVDRVGTLYAAYDLLYRLGCRWFAPGEANEEIPDLKLTRLREADVMEEPAFLTRGFHAWEDRGNPDFLLWMARNRLNYWCVEQSNHPLLHKLGIQMSCGAHDAQARFLNPAAPYPYDCKAFTGDEAKLQDPYRPSSDFQGDADKDGKLSTFEAHPEWFALAGGKRIPGIRGDGGTNFCTSNPDATTEFFKNYVQALIDGPYRDAGVVRFWTLDGGKWCQCDACKALGTPTDRNLLLAHRLDQEIKKAGAEHKINRPIIIRFLAYADVLQPPSRPLPAGFDCTATFFPIVRCYVHRFDDPACPRNANYCRQLAGWATDPRRHYRGQLCIGEYYNVSGYKCLPICYMHTMASDIPYFHKAGARHFHYMHVTTGNWGNKALTNYQMARQLWDVKTDCEELWADYFARRYGGAAPTMRRFYESLEKMLSNVSELKYGLARRLNAGAEDLFPTSHLRYYRHPKLACDGPTLVEILQSTGDCRSLIGQALAVATDERTKARVAEDERLFTYGERTLLYYDACVQALQFARMRVMDKAEVHDREARRQLAEARRLADLLRHDTASTKHSSSHANASDAFAATYAAGALAHIEKLLGPPRR